MHLCHSCNQKIVKDGYSYCFSCNSRINTKKHKIIYVPKPKPLAKYIKSENINYLSLSRGDGLSIPIDKNNNDKFSDWGPNIEIDAIENDKTVKPVKV
jgi:hypothetical protein